MANATPTPKLGARKPQALPDGTNPKLSPEEVSNIAKGLMANKGAKPGAGGQAAGTPPLPPVGQSAPAGIPSSNGANPLTQPSQISTTPTMPQGMPGVPQAGGGNAAGVPGLPSPTAVQAGGMPISNPQPTHAAPNFKSGQEEQFTEIDQGNGTRTVHKILDNGHIGPVVKVLTSPSEKVDDGNPAN